MAKEKTYRIVTRGTNGELRARDYEHEDAVLRMHTQIGIDDCSTDLTLRGMLDETLVVWGTEFGRSPGGEGSNGRDHHPFGFSVWLAGGGVKGGVVHVRLGSCHHLRASGARRNRRPS